MSFWDSSRGRQSRENCVRAASGFCLRTVPLRGACGIVFLGIVPRNTTRAPKASLKQFPRSDEKRGFRHRLTPADEETNTPLPVQASFPSSLGPKASLARAER